MRGRGEGKGVRGEREKCKKGMRRGRSEEGGRTGREGSE